MKKFKYIAVSPEGERQKGVIPAVSEERAVQLIRGNGLIVVFLKEEKSFDVFAYFRQMKGVSALDLIVFTRQLSVMLDSGIPIVKALSALKEQTRDENLSETIKEIELEIDGGMSMHQAMSRHTNIFDDLYLSLVDAGESSGNLSLVLDRLSQTLQRDHDFKGKTKSAMIYPAVILSVMIAVVILMFIFVIPRLQTLYEEMGADLPITTKIMLAISDIFVSYWWIVLVSGGLGFYALVRFLATEKGQKIFSQIQLRIPVFGLLIKQIQIASFTRTLAMLINSGLPILRGLEISKQTMSNLVFREGVDEASEAVEKGGSLGEELGRNPQFPTMFSEMVKVGEQTGKLDDVLGDLADFFEAEALRTVDNLSALLEPVIMVLLGVGIGVLIISLILPIYGLTSQF